MNRDVRARLTRCLVLAGLLGAGACFAADAPLGRSYAPGAFDSMAFEGSATVRFVQGERDEVFIEGDEDVQRAITLELNGTRLTLRTTGGWMVWRQGSRARVQVTARELKEVRISGAADFVATETVNTPMLAIDIAGAGLARFEKLHTEELRFTVSGSGDGHFQGTAQRVRLSIAGRGDFFGENLKAERVRIGISGVGKARVWATQELNARVSGIGQVDYWGEPPEVNKRSAGFGRFVDRGAKAPAP